MEQVSDKLKDEIADLIVKKADVTIEEATLFAEMIQIKVNIFDDMFNLLEDMGHHFENEIIDTRISNIRLKLSKYDG